VKLPDNLRSKVAGPVLEQLTQGLSSNTIALTIGVGLAIAVIPVIGVTTILSFLAAWAFRLNQPIIQAINWTSYPLQLLLLFPFIRMPFASSQRARIEAPRRFRRGSMTSPA